LGRGRHGERWETEASAEAGELREEEVLTTAGRATDPDDPRARRSGHGEKARPSIATR